MKKFLLLFFLISFKLFSQTNCSQGYYINNLNVKTDCWIFYFDENDDITKINIKSDKDSKMTKLDLANIIEFGFYEKENSVYKKANVKIDVSNDKITKLSTDFEPNYIEKTVFIRQLVSGKANLYMYVNMDYIRFFYSLDGSAIEPLEYKKYFVRTEIKENIRYKQVLYNLFKDAGIKSSEVESTEYKSDDLIELFNKYNVFFGGEKVSNQKQKKSNTIDFNLIVRPGVNFSSASFKHGESFYGEAKFGSKMSLRLGLELEIMAGKMYSFVVEPTYRTYKNNGQQVVGSLSQTTYQTEFEYNSIEIPISLRRYFNINNDLSCFVNGGIQTDFLLSDKFQKTIVPGTEIKPNINFSLGIGLRYKSLYYFEFNYDTERNLSTIYTNRSSKFNNIGLILGYKLF